MVRQAPLGHDGAAAGHDAGHAPRGQGHVGEAHPSVDREVVDALLRLLDQRVAEDLPGQLLRLALDPLEGLVDRHRADRHRGIAQDPLARLVDVLAGREIHHRVAAPARRPGHLLDFLLDGGADGRVADVGVDLHEELAADDHRLGFGMVDVGRDDGTAAGHLVAHELHREALADRDELHLRRDLAPLRVVHLRHVAPAAQDLSGPGHRQIGRALALRRHPLVAAAGQDPGAAQLRQAGIEVDLGSGVRVRAGGVVDPEGRVDLCLAAHPPRRMKGDLAKRNAHPVRPLGVDLARPGQGLSMSQGIGRKHLVARAHTNLPTAALPASGLRGLRAVDRTLSRSRCMREVGSPVASLECTARTSFVLLLRKNGLRSWRNNPSSRSTTSPRPGRARVWSRSSRVSARRIRSKRRSSWLLRSPWGTSSSSGSPAKAIPGFTCGWRRCARSRTESSARISPARACVCCLAPRPWPWSSRPAPSS